MKVVIETYKSFPCHADFFINDKKADLADFGEVKQNGLGEYQCGLSGFAAKMPSIEILDKYHITVDEYAEIIEKLNATFDYGICDWCM